MLMPLAGLLPTPPCDDAGSRFAYRRGDSRAERASAIRRAGSEGTGTSPGPASPPSAKGPADEPSDTDDFHLAVESLDSAPAQPMRERRRRTLHGAVRLAVAVASVVAVAAVLVSSLRGATTATPPAPAPTPGPVLPRGWVVAGPPYAQAIAFAPSAPATAYTCGAIALDEPGAPPAIYIGISHDYGRSWQTLPAPLLSPNCDIGVDPNDPRDVALVTEVCAACSAGASLNVYRSTDGGDNWSLWPLPPWGAGSPRDFSGYRWTWAGSTLYLAQAIDDGRSGYILLAASINQGPFMWVGQHRLFAEEPSGASINSLIGLDGALYLTFDCSPGCLVTSTRTMRSSDGGATWTPFDPTFQGHTVYLVGSRVASANLFGFTVPASGEAMTSGDVLRSADGGRTWQTLPPIPAMLSLVDIVAAPDGTTYAELLACCGPADRLTPEGIYRLKPGSTRWSFVGQLPGGTSTPIVLSWDSAGHPRALWSVTYQPSGPFQTSDGMAYHLP